MNENELYKTIRILNIEENLKDFKTFSFSSDHNIKYKSGQYLTLVRYDHEQEIRRSYSITSSPALNEPLSIGVKRIENGFFSRILVDTAIKHDKLLTIGAGGLFVLPDDINSYKQVFFFAAGSGITPIYSLINTLLYAHEHTNIVLIYSNTSQEKTIYFNELNQLQQKFKYRFHIEFLFSNTVQLTKARLHRNMIFQLLKKHSIAGHKQTLFYVCGPESYMRLCAFTLHENDVPKNNIKREDFVINKVHKRDALPLDKNSRNISISFNHQQFSLTQNYPDSILQAAKKSNINLPYSCEAGRCGSCIAKCITGRVWHSYNEVLTEKELEQGLVLTCVGHAVEGDVILEINS